MPPRKVFANKSAAFLVSEDWFANSHFRGLIADYCRQFETVHVVTRLKDHAAELERLGARPIHFDFQRVATNPLVQMRVIGRLGHLLAELQPDHVHGIAAQVNVVAASALMLRRLRPTFFMHITGIGFIGDVEDPVARLLRPVAMMPLRIASRWPTSAVFVENPEDAQFLKDRGVGIVHPITVLGGAGVDAEFMTACPDPANEAPIAAFVGRLILSKGLHELIEAGRILRERGVKGSIRLFGRADGVKGDYFDPAQLQSTDGLSAQSGVEYCGFEFGRSAHLAAKRYIRITRAQARGNAKGHAGGCGVWAAVDRKRCPRLSPFRARRRGRNCAPDRGRRRACGRAGAAHDGSRFANANGAGGARTSNRGLHR